MIFVRNEVHNIENVGFKEIMKAVGNIPQLFIHEYTSQILSNAGSSLSK